MLTKLTRIILISLVYCLMATSCEDDPYEANSGTFTDKRDNHEYPWVKIGTQIWMAENLAYVPYACAPDSQCGIWVQGYYGSGSFYANYTTYGCLYDWETALEACPEGWHLPSDEEWMELESFLGMENDELYNIHWRGYSNGMYGKLGIGTDEWNFSSQYATNESGFTALPGGSRIFDNRLSFANPGYDAYFWTSTIHNEFPSYAYFRHLGASGIFRDNINKNFGFSLRCLKN